MERRFKAGFIVVLLLAAAIAVEPLIHTHPLTQSSNAPCAVCVASVGRLSALHPTPVAPITIVTTIALLPAAAIIQRAAMPLASRAPPAA